HIVSGYHRRSRSKKQETGHETDQQANQDYVARRARDFKDRSSGKEDSEESQVRNNRRSHDQREADEMDRTQGAYNQDRLIDRRRDAGGLQPRENSAENHLVYFFLTTRFCWRSWMKLMAFQMSVSLIFSSQACMK